LDHKIWHRNLRVTPYLYSCPFKMTKPSSGTIIVSISDAVLAETFEKRRRRMRDDERVAPRIHELPQQTTYRVHDCLRLSFVRGKRKKSRKTPFLCKTYLLLPGVLALDDSSVKPILELGILKNTIHFRNVAEIGSNDVDSIVLQSVAYRGLPAAHSSDCRAQ
jgi:hypothetical protein